MRANEEARVEKKNGQILGPYKAKFAGDTIIINDPLADIDDGDIILRRLPNGKDQRSYVTKATFYDTHIGGFGPHFQVKFKSASAVEHPKPVQNIHINNAQSIQIGDNNTQNIVNSIEALIQKIDSIQVDQKEKDEAKSLLSKFLSHPLVVSVLGTAVGTLGN